MLLCVMMQVGAAEIELLSHAFKYSEFTDRGICNVSLHMHTNSDSSLDIDNGICFPYYKGLKWMMDSTLINQGCVKLYRGMVVHAQLSSLHWLHHPLKDAASPCGLLYVENLLDLSIGQVLIWINSAAALKDLLFSWQISPCCKPLETPQKVSVVDMWPFRWWDMWKDISTP